MRRTYRGITLIEVIVVGAILAVLAAILLPVFIRSKQSAGSTVIRSNLHQVSVAWNLYDPDGHDDHPSALRLQALGLVSADLLYSRKDRYPLGEGVMTALCGDRQLRICGATSDHLTKAGRLRSSVLSWGDISGVPFREPDDWPVSAALAGNATNLGFFASFLEFPSSTLELYLGGRRPGERFYRVTRDGAVVDRRLPEIDIPTGQKGVPRGALFYDDPRWSR